MSEFCSSKKDNTMKVLVLNCGSSSIKYKLFNTADHSVEAQGGIEKIGLKGSFLKITLPSGEKVVLEKDIPEHTAGIDFILNTLVGEEYGCIKSLDEIGAGKEQPFSVHFQTAGESLRETSEYSPDLYAEGIAFPVFPYYRYKYRARCDKSYDDPP